MLPFQSRPMTEFTLAFYRERLHRIILNTVVRSPTAAYSCKGDRISDVKKHHANLHRFIQGKVRHFSRGLEVGEIVCLAREHEVGRFVVCRHFVLFPRMTGQISYAALISILVVRYFLNVGDLEPQGLRPKC